MFCARFVQYNQLSQDLAFDSRLVETIQHLARAANTTGDAEQVTNQRAAWCYLTNQRAALCHMTNQSSPGHILTILTNRRSPGRRMRAAWTRPSRRCGR